MINFKDSKLWNWLTNTNPQYFALAAALFLEFILMSLEGFGFYFMEHYMIMPTMLFLGMTFGRPLPSAAWRQMILPFLMVCWFFITQTLHYSMDLQVRSAGLFFSVYVLAYLFASFSQDGRKQWGMHLASIACIGAALMLALFTALYSADLLPGFLKPHIRWDGARLHVLWHPNIAANIVMMGIAFLLFQIVQARKTWFKVLCVITTVVLFYFMALTNCRTVIIMTSCIIAGLLFLRIYSNSNWKRFVIGAIVAVAVIALLFTTAQFIFQRNEDRLIAKYTLDLTEHSFADSIVSDDNPGNSSSSSAEKAAVIINQETGEVTFSSTAPQGSFLEDLSSLNGRSVVWKACLQAVREHPKVLLIGTDLSDPLISAYMHWSPGHAHNAWMETLICLGLPGLLIALAFTAIAVRHIWLTFWSKSAPLGHKVIAMLVLCLMGTSITEPYLFFSDYYYHHTDFMFFLCLGYLVHWRAEAKK